MADGYNPKSCNALERPFYRPIEAAIRWCGLIAEESNILGALGSDPIPKTGQFPQWDCLKANTEKILDAIVNGNIPHGRDGKTVVIGDHVKPERVTVRHADLREWMVKYEPDQKPAFLFGEIERKASTVSEQKAIQVIAALLAVWPGGKHPTGKDLERAAQSVGVTISDDTIRKVLEAARSIAPSLPPA